MCVIPQGVSIGVRSVVVGVAQLLLQGLSCCCSWIMEKILIRHQSNESSRCDNKEYLSWLLSSEERKRQRLHEDRGTSDNEDINSRNHISIKILLYK